MFWNCLKYISFIYFFNLFLFLFQVYKQWWLQAPQHIAPSIALSVASSFALANAIALSVASSVASSWATWVVQRELQFSRIHWCHVRGWLWQTNKWFSKFICLNWKGRALKICAGPSNIQPANSIRNHFVHVWMMSVPTISHTKNQPHGKNWSMAKRLVLPLSSSHSSSLWKRFSSSCSLQVFSWVPSNVGGEMVFLIDTLNESALSKTLQCLRAPQKRGKCLYHTCWKNHI